MSILYIGNDMLLELAGSGMLVDQQGNPVTGATVEATIFEADGVTEVEGITWPLTLVEGAIAGEYSVIIQSEVEIEADKKYIIKITAAKGDVNSTWIMQTKAKNRLV